MSLKRLTEAAATSENYGPTRKDYSKYSAKIVTIIVAQVLHTVPLNYLNENRIHVQYEHFTCR